MNENKDFNGPDYPTAAHGTIPSFNSYEEEAKFWDTHSISDFKNETKPVLYVGYLLYQKPINSNATPTTTLATLTVAALNANDGKNIWQSAIFDISPGEDAYNIHLTVAESLLCVVFSQAPGKCQAVGLDAKTGRILWRHTVDAGSMYPIIAANRVFYIRVGENTLQALDGQSGKLLWSVSTGEYVLGQGGQIVVTSKAVFLLQWKLVVDTPEPSYSALVRALRLSDGGEIWQKEVANLTGGANFPNLLSLQADDQAIYVLKWQSKQGLHPSEDMRTLVAFRAQDGSPLWSVNNLQENLDTLAASLVLFEQVLYLVDLHSMSFFNAQDGRLFKTYTTPFNLIYTTAIDSRTFVPKDYLYANGPGKKERFCALKSSDGTKLWCSDLYPDVGLIFVGKENVYFSGYRAGEQRAIYILSQQNGSQIGRYTPGDPALVNTSSISMAFAEERF
ncbi:MAG: PQQ-binding-like beta-propeller repeat protein [Ktedonobacteraceae bacterium]